MHFNIRHSVANTLRFWLALSTLQLDAWALPYRGRYNEGICTDTTTGRELFIGEAFTRPGQCVRVQCLGNLQLWEDRCQTPKLNGNCNPTPPQNEYQDYPKCCPLYECKTYATNERGETEELRVYDHYGNIKRTFITQVFVINRPLDGSAPGTGVKSQFEI